MASNNRSIARGTITSCFVLVLGMLIFGPSEAVAQALSPEARAAWRQAGAQVYDSKKANAAEIRFGDRPKTPLAKLPAPDRTFVLSVLSRHLTPDDYKELARFKALTELTLNSGHELVVKDGKVPARPASDLKGISALAALPDLHVLKLEAMNTTESAFAEIAALKSLKKIDCFGATFNDAGLAHLGKLPALEVFHATGDFTVPNSKTVTAAGIKGLAAAPRLHTLQFYHFPLDDEGLKHLGNLKNLQSVTVWDTHFHGATFGDDGLRHLAGAKTLSTLNFGVLRCRITDEGVKHLVGLKELTSLDLRYAEVTDEGVKDIAKLTKLKRLDLSATAISNAGLEHLKSLTNLEYLDLRGNGSLTGAGVKHLHALKRLERLELAGTKMHGTPARDALLAELRKALPKCQIQTERSYGDPY